MSETTVVCPKCHSKFEFTAAMRAGIEATLRAQLETQEAERREVLEARARELDAGAAAIVRERAALEVTVAQQVAAGKDSLAKSLKEQALKEAAAELAAMKESVAASQLREGIAIEREQAAIKKERECEVKAAAMDNEIAERTAKLVREERKGIEEAARLKAAENIEAERSEFERKDREKGEKLAVSQQNEVLHRRKVAELEEQARDWELEKQRAVDAERQRVYEKARSDEADQHRMKDAEKDKLITDLHRINADMQRKLDTTSQQLQGEVQELDLEASLRAAFPRDIIEPVPKGQFGGDAVQLVVGASGQVVGRILWEFKRTRTWSDGWLSKLKNDQRAAKADVCAIVTAAMPKGVEHFGHVEQVWVSSIKCATPLATSLRLALIEVSSARASGEGRASKVEMVYEYLTGKDFRNRIEAMRQAYEEMRDDLEGERKAITARWAKRDKQIQRALEAATGMYGDLQGIAGKSMGQIEGFEVRGLES